VKIEDNLLTQSGDFNSQLGNWSVLVNNWLRQHIIFVVGFITFIGFLLRILPTGKIYLNPDECLHYLIVHQHNIYQVWLNSLTNAHPPLFFFILFIWTKLGNSELFLRLISVLSGTALIYVGYKWAEKCFGKSVGLVMCLLLAFSPTLIALSQEVRGYSVLILFMTLTLYYFQLLLEKSKILHLILFSVFLYLAILIHYSVVFFVIALGLYFVYLLLQKSFNRKIVVVWSLFQLGALGIYGFLYRTHLSQLSKSALRQEIIQGWLASSYLDLHQTNLKEIFLYPFVRTIDVFQYLFSLKNCGVPLSIAFIVAVIIVGSKRWRRIGIFLFLPFVANLVASVFKIYPYGGTRHILYLSLFAFIGIGYLLGRWFEKRLQLILILGSILIPLWIIFSQKPEQFIKPKNQRLVQMRQAKEYIESYLPKDDVIFTDYQTNVMLGYYLAQKEILPLATFQNGFLQSSYDGYKFITSDIWTFNVANFLAQFRRLVSNFKLDSTGPIWIVDAGWGWNLRDELINAYPGFPFLRQGAYGDNISIFQLPVEEILKLATPLELTDRVNSVLLSLSKATRDLKEIKYRTVFWPTDQGWDAFRHFWIDSTLPVVPLEKLYKKLIDNPKSLDDFLPALVFWIFHNREQHIQFFSFMEEGQNYIAAGYSFTLRFIDPDGIAAVYEINRVRGYEQIIIPDDN